ncbi:MAG: DNA repair protein RecO [Candidatus Dojkabacteria bacterium]|jgi:DNA repair protein RecO (recombination protein O)|nr:DNA repair protein RecO [Candidatus Dojkabacteria bacterium]MDD4561024.1 DNA repair protein RecO [Candidatus Dojkabacteria bacterium]HQA99253.1 DNA repair protein RecO [Candidatus Dojkabacteria bacterium]
MSRDTVVVIKSINYSEADRIVTVFGRELGKFTLFARGIRKINSKNRGNIQTLYTSKISFYEGKGMPLLTESESVASLDIDNLDMNNAKRILFLLNKFLQEYDPYPNLFDALQRALALNLDSRSMNKLRIKFLKEMGFLNDFSSCIHCGSKKDIQYIDSKNFALVCKNCYSNSNSKPLGKDPYGSSVLTEIIDNYIKRIVEEI